MIAKLAHKVAADPAVAATCAKTGLTAGSHCSVCKTVFKKQTVIAKLAHKVAADPAVAATCAKTGLTAGSHCSVCKTVIRKQTVTAKLAHKWNSGKVTEKATAVKKGTRKLTCSVCGAVKTEKIPAVKIIKGKTYTIGNLKYKVTNASTNGKGKVTVVGVSGSKTALKTLKLANTVKISGASFLITEIGAKAFSGCTKLTAVTVGKNVSVIGKNAFYGCKALTKVTLGSGVTKISDQAFMNCGKLKNLTISSKKLKTVGRNAVKNGYKKMTIKVPSGKVSAYKKLFKAAAGFQKTMKLVK